MKTIESITQHDAYIVEKYIMNNAPNLHLFLIYFGLDEIGDNTKINDTERFLRENGVEFYEYLYAAINDKGENNLIIREMRDSKEIDIDGNNIGEETGRYFILSKELAKKIIILDNLS